MDYEARYRGELLGHWPSEEAARAHAREHFTGGKPDVHVQDPDNFTIEPRRPVELRCRGNLVDTFHTREGAEAQRAKLATKEAPAKVWTIAGP